MARAGNVEVGDNTLLILAGGLLLVGFFAERKVEGAIGAVGKGLHDVGAAVGGAVGSFGHEVARDAHDVATLPNQLFDYATHPIVVDPTTPSGLRVPAPPADLSRGLAAVPGGFLLDSGLHHLATVDAVLNAPPGSVHSPLPSPSAFAPFGVPLGSVADAFLGHVPQFFVDRSNDAINGQQAFVGQRADNAYTARALDRFAGDPGSYHGGF